jgi:hypothetical protein
MRETDLITVPRRTVPRWGGGACTLAIVFALAAPAHAIDPRHPDWPCHRIKVPELSLAAVWTGPDIGDVGNAWREDRTVSDLVARVVARRTPQEEAEKAIAEFITGDAATRERKAKLVMAGVFALLGAERAEVMNGIERFARRQKGFADKIREETRRIRELQDKPNPDPEKIDELVKIITWDTRIFEDQKRTITYVCDVPQAIERRVFILARAIQQALE